MKIPDGIISMQELSVKDRVRFYMQNLLPHATGKTERDRLQNAYARAVTMEQHDQQRLAALLKEGKIRA